MSGVEDENVIHFDRATGRIIRKRSFALLGSVLAPLRARVVLLAVTVLAGQGARASVPFVIALAVDAALPALIAGDARPILLQGGLCLALAIGGGVLTWQAIRITAWISQTALIDLRRRVFLHVQRLSLEFHERYTSGRSIARQTSDLEALRELLDSGVSQLLTGLVYMGFVAALLTALDPVSGLLLLVAVVPVALFTRWFHHASGLHYRSTRVASANLIVHFVESLAGIRALQAFRRERPATEEHARLSEEYRVVDQKTFALQGKFDPALLLVGNLTVALVLAVDGFRVLSGDLPVGTLIAAILYAKRFFTPVAQMAQFYNSLQSAIASLEKISGLLDERPGIEDPAEPKALPTRAGESGGAVALRGVTFGYHGGPPQVADLDLEVPAGQTVALIGATGAGKSTLVKLIARFYDVGSGSIALDGVDVRNLSSVELRRAVVVVTQEAFLFSGSVADNIALGRSGATRDDVIAAAKAAGADEFIRTLPDGYDTDVNKRGGRLSAGQRQLVAFARAFVAQPRVLILDEASSSLDMPSEAMVQRALERLLVGRTAIIIAHRLSTLDIADRVVVMQHGRIIADGAPDELAKQGGEYAALRAEWISSTSGH